jgi:hypothetical protein
MFAGEPRVAALRNPGLGYGIPLGFDADGIIDGLVKSFAGHEQPPFLSDMGPLAACEAFYEFIKSESRNFFAPLTGSVKPSW